MLKATQWMGVEMRSWRLEEALCLSRCDMIKMCPCSKADIFASQVVDSHIDYSHLCSKLFSELKPNHFALINKIFLDQIKSKSE